MSDYRPLFGVRLEAKRRARGYTIDQLAELIGVSPVTIFRWQKGASLPEGEHARKLSNTLDFEISELSELFEEYILNNQRKRTEYKVRGYEYVEQHFDSWLDFLKVLLKIDLRAMPHSDVYREGSAEYWAPIFQENPFSWKLLEYMGEIVGYWHYIPLRDEVFPNAVQGNLVETSLSRDDIDPVILEGDYRIYLSMAVLDLPHRVPEASSALKGSFVKHVSKLARRGYFFSEMCAYAATPAGEDICCLLGMKRLKTTSDGKEPVYYASGSDICSRGFLKKDTTIGRLYRQRFSC